MTAPVLIDTHAHLDDERFGSDLPAVLERARLAGVRCSVAVATTGPSSERVQELARAHPDQLSASAGIHPNHAAEAAPGDWDRVVALVRAGKAVALGETGLDRYWDYTPFEVQQDYFARHLALAREMKLPVIIHSRDCDADMLRMLREEFDRHGPIRGVMHSFCSTKETAEACLAMGLLLSLSGQLTRKNAHALRDVAARLPLEKLMVETDCPYLTPEPVKGKRNEPANVVHTAARLAEVLGVDLATLAERTTANACALFGLPPPSEA